MRDKVYLGWLWVVLLGTPSLLSQPQIRMLGRWAEGSAGAVFRRGGFTFVGNGAYLEVYKTQRGVYQRLDRLVLSDKIQDLWVKGDTTHVFAACGQAGVEVVYFDYKNRRLVQRIGGYNTPGFASAVMEVGGYTYVADGPSGLVILYTGIPSTPQFSGALNLKGFSRELWVRGTTAFVAADTAGIYSVDVQNPSNPFLLNQLHLAAPFATRPNPEAFALLVVGNDTLAYVAAGWGGMQILNIKNPSSPRIVAFWPDAGLPIYARDVWVSGRYAHLASEDRIYPQIDISDVSHITGPLSTWLEISGQPTKIVADRDTAFLAAGSGGHPVVDVNVAHADAPQILTQVMMGDACQDVINQGDYLYVAAGRAGFRIFLVQSQYPNTLMTPIGDSDTPGNALGLAIIGNYLHVADGPSGLRIYDVADRTRPIFKGAFTQVTDLCRHVATPPGSYAFVACGRDGLRILDYSRLDAITSVYRIDTPGSARTIRVVGDRGYLADSTAVRIYRFVGFPGLITAVQPLESLESSPTRPLEALSLAVRGDTVVVANGRYGLLVWQPTKGKVDTLSLGGICTDVRIVEKTIYATVIGQGLRLLNYTSDGTFTPLGSFPTAGTPRRLSLSTTGDRIWVAAGEGGLYDLESALRPEIAVTPVNLDFGTVPPGYSRTRKVWITNTGTKDLIVSRIQIVGLTTAFSFSETAFTVPPGETKRLFVTFTPSLLGASVHVATASIYSNAVNSPTTLFLQGEGGTPIGQTPYKSDPFTLGLWHFDETDGVTTIQDASGNNLHGQPLGTTPRIEGKSGFGRALQFNGDGGRIEIPSHPLLNLADTPFTIELWFSMIQPPGGNAVLVKRGIGTGQQVEFALSGEGGVLRLVGKVWNPEGLEWRVQSDGLRGITVGQWLHAAFSWDGDSLRLFLNGALIGSRSYYGSLRNVANQPLTIGAAADGTQGFNGRIDEVRLSSIARQSWEFHVDHSRIAISTEVLHFGDVLLGAMRRLPIRIRSVGEANLTIYGISATDGQVRVQTTKGFVLPAGKDTLLWVTFTPDLATSLPKTAALVIASTDPTYPFLEIPLIGRGVETLPAGQQRTDPFTLGLYHFSRVEETTVFDSSGYGFHGTLHGGALLDTTGGKFGQYLRLSGVAEYVSVPPPHDPTWGPRWGGFTAEAWIRLTTLPVDSPAVLFLRGTPERRQFAMRIDRNGRLVGLFWNTKGSAYRVESPQSETLSLQQWYHVACTLDLYADSLSLYLNGRRIAKRAFVGDWVGTDVTDSVHDTPLYIGGDPSQHYPFIGAIDEVRISGIARQVWEFNVNLARSNIYPVQIDFGKVLLGQQKAESFWVENTGFEVLNVFDLRVVSEQAGMFRIDTTRFDLKPKERRRVWVTYSPNRIGTHLATIRPITNNLFPDRTVSLQGVCISARESGVYDQDPKTLHLLHFDRDEQPIFQTSGRVSFSDTSRFGGTSLRFKGGYVWFSTDSTLNLAVTPITLELWFSISKLPSGGQATLVRWEKEPFLCRFLIDPTTGLTAEISSQGQEIRLFGLAFRRLVPGRWYHLALTWDGEAVRWSNNNILYDAKPMEPFSIPKNARLTIGADPDGKHPFDGWVDEFRFSLTKRESWEFNVLPPLIMLSASSLHFTQVPLNQTLTREFRLTNQGDQDLIIQKVQVSGTGFTQTGLVAPDTLPRLHSRLVRVTFKPTALQRYEGSITITSNDTSAPSSVITLMGEGIREKRVAPYAADDPNTLALYRFDRDFTQPNRLLDVTGNGLHGVIHGATWVPGVYQDALAFDGRTSWVAIPPHPSVTLTPDRPFTIEITLLSDTITTRQWLVAKGREDSLAYGLYLDAEGRATVAGFGGGGERLTDGRWHQVAFVYNPFDSSRLYVDGRKVLSRRWLLTGTDRGDSLRIGAAMGASGQRVGFFKGRLDEFRISDVARDAWEIRPGEYGIAMTYGTAPPKAGESFTLSVTMPAWISPDTVSVFVRRGGGLRPFTQIQAGRVGTSATWRAVIPADSVTLHGLEIYIDAVSKKVHYTAPAFAPKENPWVIPVAHGRMGDALVYRTQRVRNEETGVEKTQKAALFSIPTRLNAQRVDSVFKDLLPYNPYVWRLFWWHSRLSQEKLDRQTPPYYLEHPNPDPNIFQFAPGRAFWLVVKTDQRFQIPSGVGLPTNGLFEIPLNPGWNMVGSPFTFPVAWDDCIIVGTDLIQTLYAWRGEEGFVSEVPYLLPWEGYFVYNPDSLVARLIIPPREARIQPGTTSKRHLAYALTQDEWLLYLTVESRGLRDGGHVLGVRCGASSALDRFDRFEPPPAIGQEIRLVLERGLMADIRSPGESGYVWEVLLQSPYAGDVFSLEWSFQNTLPKGWRALLFDRSEGNTVDLTGTHRLIRKAASDGKETFKIVVGTPAFIEDHRENYPLEPIPFALAPNFPNPFNPETTIQYSIPKAGEVEFVVFNVLGQRIYTLKRHHDMAGHYQIVWHGVQDSGIPVASGVYFYQLKMADQMATRKMVIIR